MGRIFITTVLILAGMACALAQGSGQPVENASPPRKGEPVVITEGAVEPTNAPTPASTEVINAEPPRSGEPSSFNEGNVAAPVPERNNTPAGTAMPDNASPPRSPEN